MAKNWSVAEAVDAINNGDKESIVDIGRRFPLLLNSVKGALAGDKQSFLDFVAALPEYDTANKINKRMKDGVEVSSEDVPRDVDDKEEDVEEKKPVKKAAGKSAKKVKEEEQVDDEVDYSEMDAKELFTLCKERGIKAAVKKPAKYYIGLLEKADAEDADGEDDWDEEEDEKPAKKATKKSEKKPAKKAKKEEQDDDDDDEEWDI